VFGSLYMKYFPHKFNSVQAYAAKRLQSAMCSIPCSRPLTVLPIAYPLAICTALAIRTHMAFQFMAQRTIIEQSMTIRNDSMV
jgi:hypothetical protein